MRRAIYAGLVGLAIVGCSSGGGGLSIPGVAKSYTFSINVKPNQAFSYDMSMGMSGAAAQPQSPAQSLDMSMTMTAEKVENDQTTFRTKITKMNMNGQPMPPQAATMMQNMSIVQVMDKHGKVLSTQVEGVPGAQPPTNSFTSAAFPDHAVKVGDTWSATTQGTTVNYKLVSVDSKGGKNVAEIDATAAPGGTLKTPNPIKIVVDVDTGMPVSAEVDGMDTGQGQVKMTMKQTS